METTNVKGRELRRVFKGQTEFLIDHSTPEKLEASKRNRHFYQRMLRAYHKGQELFNFGYAGRDHLGRLVPQQHKVLFGWE